MADITRAATPINNRNIIQPTKENRNANEVPFDFQDTSKVKQTTPQSDMQQNNNVLREDGSTTAFYQVMHDPDVSSMFLKNIFLLQQIVDILPFNNSTQTQEMQDLLNQLVLTPEEIPAEMMRQEDISTIFKGGFFDFLRELIKSNPQEQGISDAVSNLLKTLNNDTTKESIMTSVSNNLDYIKAQVKASPQLSEKLDSLTEQLQNFSRLTNSLKNLSQYETQFTQLKSQVFSTFSDIEKSILFNDDIAKALSMTTYNLSRISTTDNAVEEAFTKVLSFIENDTDKEKLTNELLKFFDDNSHVSNSKTMNALTEILRKQSESADIKLLNSDSVDKIIYSLLSSPCNYTPLLHYVIPVEYEDTKAFAEMWVNPDGEEDISGGTKAEKCIHLLSVFEIEDLGTFETELFAEDKRLTLNILCPEPFTEYFKGTISQIRNGLSTSDYKLKSISVDTLKKPRSLIEVFKSLPQRRAGVNVTI